MPGGGWVRDPNRGGIPIPGAVQERTTTRLQVYAERHFAGKFTRLGIRFQKQFCYIDAYTEPEVPEPWPPADFASANQDSPGTNRTPATDPLASVSSPLFWRRGTLRIRDVRLQQQQVRIDHATLRRLFRHPEEALARFCGRGATYLN